MGPFNITVMQRTSLNQVWSGLLMHRGAFVQVSSLPNMVIKDEIGEQVTCFEGRFFVRPNLREEIPPIISVPVTVFYSFVWVCLVLMCLSSCLLEALNLCK
jgi:hypothetical protein